MKWLNRGHQWLMGGGAFVLAGAVGTMLAASPADARMDLCDTYEPYCLQAANCEHGCIEVNCFSDSDCPVSNENPNDFRKCYACWHPEVE